LLTKGKEKAILKRKRIHTSTTNRMEQEMEERLVEEKKEGRLWGTRIAHEHPCNLREKCPRKGGICLNYQGKHLTVVPAIVRLWEEACIEGRATEMMPPDDILEKLVTA
jgi:hypothetical protein